MSFQPMDSNSVLFIEIDEETAVASSIVEICDDLPSPSFRQVVFSTWQDAFLRKGGFVAVMATFLFMILTTSVYLVSGLEISKKTGLSASVSAVVTYFLKLLIFTTFSSTSVFVFGSFRRVKALYLWLALAVFATHLLTPFPDDSRLLVYCSIDVYWGVVSEDVGNGMSEWCKRFMFWTAQTWIFERGARLNISADIVMGISIIINSVGSSISSSGIDRASTSSLPVILVFYRSCLDKSIMKLLPVAAARVRNLSSTLKEKKRMVKLIHYSLGLGGSVLFQYFFQIKTLDHVIAMFRLAFAWLASLTLCAASNDFGVLNFLLGNIVAGSVNQYGPGITTWLVCGACVLLYSWRLKSTPNKGKTELRL